MGTVEMAARSLSVSLDIIEFDAEVIEPEIMRRDTRRARVSGSLSNKHAGPRRNSIPTSDVSTYGGYAVPRREWRTFVAEFRIWVANSLPSARIEAVSAGGACPMEKDYLTLK